MVEHGGLTLSRYDVSFSPDETWLETVTNARLFATRHRPPQLKLIALEDALGDAGQLKTLELDAYAPRSPRLTRALLQGALFAYLDAL